MQNINQDKTNLLSEAMEFADLCAGELSQKSSTDWHERRNEVESLLQTSGIYSLSFEELEHGARVAWRNNARCIGRLFWS
ncbi:MAG: nitric oxide synthase oxygenase, partial [Verrucomicrobiota bacterium]|nr:nitric oxide synthase oxygenase [Verrucomicrobiota bacterium]